jgi:energy-coupling factor transporter transmembrane protein EcfT
VAELARLPPETLQLVLILFRKILTLAQPHFIVMLLAILLVLFVGVVARLTRRLLFAR